MSSAESDAVWGDWEVNDGTALYSKLLQLETLGLDVQRISANLPPPGQRATSSYDVYAAILQSYVFGPGGDLRPVAEVATSDGPIDTYSSADLHAALVLTCRSVDYFWRTETGEIDRTTGARYLVSWGDGFGEGVHWQERDSAPSDALVVPHDYDETQIILPHRFGVAMRDRAIQAALWSKAATAQAETGDPALGLQRLVEQLFTFGGSSFIDGDFTDPKLSADIFMGCMRQLGLTRNVAFVAQLAQATAHVAVGLRDCLQQATSQVPDYPKVAVLKAAPKLPTCLLAAISRQLPGASQVNPHLIRNVLSQSTVLYDDATLLDAGDHLRLRMVAEDKPNAAGQLARFVTVRIIHVSGEQQMSLDITDSFVLPAAA